MDKPKVLALAAKRHSLGVFFQPKERIVFYALQPLIDGKKTVAEARNDIGQIIRDEGIEIVSVEFFHKLKEALSMTAEEFWSELVDLNDQSFRVVHMDLRGYSEFLLRDESRWRGRGPDKYYYVDRYGTGDMDIGTVFRPQDVCLKNQLDPALHAQYPQLFLVPYIAPYTKSTFLMETVKIPERREEVDLWFIGAMTRRSRYDLVERAKSVEGVTFSGGITAMEKLLRDGKMPPKFEGCSMEHGVTRLSFDDYLAAFGKARLSLSIYGVGKICIRMMESMAMQTPCLSDACPLENMWLVKPEQDKHCFFYKNDWSDFEEQVRRLLPDDELRMRVAMNGHWFWKRYHRIESVGIHVDTVLEMAYEYDKDTIYEESRRRIDKRADELGIPVVA